MPRLSARALPQDAVTTGPGTDPLDERVRSIDDLLAPFHEAEKPRSAYRVGTELEKVGVYADGGAVPYEGDRGIRAVLAGLASRYGWEPETEYEGGPVLALARGRASITLEPGAQLELSGAPLRTIHETAAELATHFREIEAVGGALGITWLGLGFHPFARQADLPWVPKLRYTVMREYLPTRGDMALDMMRRTCTVQANLDYSDEEDAMRKLEASLRLQPIVTAMFANSPLYEGARTGRASQRALVWTRMDPDRSGLLPFAWSARPSYRRYVEWALDVPMFIVKRGGELLENTHQTFRQFMNEGTRGQHATRRDWETHLNTLFPEVRLKRTLEMRGADSQQRALVPALSALWKGLMYDDRALAEAHALGESLAYDDVEAARPAISQRGLGAKIGDKEVSELAARVVEIARGGLERIGDVDGEGHGEADYLVPLEVLIAQRKTPADALLERLGDDTSVAGVIAAARA